MDLGRFPIAEERVVATHVVVVDWLAQKCDRSFQEKLFRLKSFPELVQTEAGMEKSGAAVWRDAAKLSTDRQSTGPFFLAHQMMQTQLQNFRTILRKRFNGVQLGHRFSVHAEFGISGRCPQSPFKVHPWL